jgi:uncharacterized membrane protein
MHVFISPRLGTTARQLRHNTARMKLRRVVEHYRPVAGVYLVGALIIGWALPRLHGPLGSINAPMGKDQVIAFLSAVSSGMMAFTGIVFAMLFILLQFGSRAYSPHIVPLLARNRNLNHAGGVFTGTFVYSLMALRGVDAITGQTSALVVWAAFIWLMASVYMLLRLVGVFATLTITDVLDMLSEKGHHEIDRIYGRAEAESGVTPSRDGMITPTGTAMQTILHKGMPRYVLSLDVPRLVEMARAADAIIRIPVAVGDSITAGGRLALIEGSSRYPGAASRGDPAWPRSHLGIGAEERDASARRHRDTSAVPGDQ